jgi:hypothetical protein
MEVCSQLHGPATFPHYPFYRKLVGSQSRFGRCGDEKNVLPLLGIEPRLLDLLARSLVATPCELSRLHEGNE